MIRKRVLAKLWLKMRRVSDKVSRHAWHNRRNARLLSRTLNIFFKKNSPDEVRYYAMLVFQCWALHDCGQKAKVSDEEFAAHLDQLNDLVSGLHRYHLKMRFG